MTTTNTPLWVQALLDKSLSAVEYRVWSYIYWRQGSNSSAWPGLALIAFQLTLSESTVRRAIDKLCASGRLTKTAANKGGRGHTNHYSIKGIARDTVSAEKGIVDDRVSAEKGIMDDGETLSPMNTKHYTGNTIQESLSPLEVPAPAKGKARTKRTGTRRSVEYSVEFERFWTEYPKRVGKAEAFKEWQALAPDAALIKKIITSVRAWKRSDQWTKDGGRWIKDPCRFLKYRRFEDELPCLPEPQPGDPDYVPTEEEIEAKARAGGCKLPWLVGGTANV